MSSLKTDAIEAATGTNTNLALTGKGTGKVALGDAALLVPDADGAAGQILTTDGSLALTFAATPGTSGNVLTSNGSAWTSAAAGGGAWNVLSSATASTSASLEFESNIDSTYDTYAIIIEGLVFSAAAATLLTVGTGATPTYQTSLYTWHKMQPLSTSTAYSGTADNSDSDLEIANTTVTDATLDGSNLSGIIYFNNPSSAALLTLFKCHLTGIQEAAGVRLVNYEVSGAWNSATAITAVKLAPASGTFVTGKIILIGISNS